MKKETRRQRKLRFIRFKNNLVKRAGAKVKLDKTFTTCGVIGTTSKGKTIYQRFRTIMFIDPAPTIPLPFPDEIISERYATGFKIKMPELAFVVPKGKVVYYNKESNNDKED